MWEPDAYPGLTSLCEQTLQPWGCHIILLELLPLYNNILMHQMISSSYSVIKNILFVFFKYVLLWKVCLRWNYERLSHVTSSRPL